MLLPTSRLPRLSARTRRSVSWSAAWLGAFGGLELYGRRSDSDSTDLLGVAVVLALALATSREHARQPLGCVSWLMNGVRSAAGWFAQFALQTGFDLRQSPPLERRYPGLLRVLLAAVFALCVALGFGREAFPGGARAALSELSAGVYLMGLTGVWIALLYGSLSCGLYPMFWLHDYAENAVGWSDARRGFAKFRWTLLYFGGLLVLGFGLPAGAPLIVVGVLWVLVLTVCALPNRPNLQLAWQRLDGRREPAVIAWGALAATNATIAAGLIVAAVFATYGDRLGDGLWGSVSADASSGNLYATQITAFLGRMFAWGATAKFTMFALNVLGLHFAAQFRNPAAPRRTRIHVTAPTPIAQSGPFVAPRLDPPPVDGHRGRTPVTEQAAELLRDAAQALVDGGFEPSFEPEPETGDVVVELKHPDDPHGEVLLTWPPRGEWPLQVELEELDDAAVQRKLARRGEVVQRRCLMHGLERLFKASRRRRRVDGHGRSGTGTLLAPHLWFLDRLSRDIDEEQDFLLPGPSYHPTLPLAARHHFFRVMQAGELDLIYVEDGVGFRRLRRVFAALFEYYDLFGGTRAVDERQFIGLPGVCVVIRDDGFGSPLLDGLGRARVLHVFRDRRRGRDDEGPVDAPNGGGSIRIPSYLR